MPSSERSWRPTSLKVTAQCVLVSMLLAAVLVLIPVVGSAQPSSPSSADPQPSAPTAEPPTESKEPLPEPTEPKGPARPPSDAQLSICLLVESAAQAQGLPVDFFARVIWQESRFRADAVGPMTRSGSRAQGIAQFMPGTAAERGLLNPFDPIQALPKSAEFLRDLRKQFGNLGLAAAAYNAGPRRVQEWLAGTGPMPAETRNYVRAITGLTVEEWAKIGAGGDLKQRPAQSCGEMVALLKYKPSPFIEALEQKIVTGSLQPWGVILTAGFSRTRILGNYAELERKHTAILTGYDAFITQTRLYSRGPVPFYQIRIGVPNRDAAYLVCNRIRKAHGACVVLRNRRA